MYNGHPRRSERYIPQLTPRPRPPPNEPLNDGRGVVIPAARRRFAGPAGGLCAPAAYGDLVTAALALLALAALRSRLGIGLVWAFNLWGSADLLYAYYQGRIGVGGEPGQLGAAYFIPTAFRLLLLSDGATASNGNQRAV